MQKTQGQVIRGALATALFLAFSLPAAAQSFRVQCPQTTTLHPNGSTADPAHPGVVKCQEISGGDGYATMGDGTQIYTFSFGPLSGIDRIVQGLDGTQTAADFWNITTNLANAGKTEPADIMNTGVLYGNSPAPLMVIDEDDEFFLTLSNVGQIMRPDLFEQHTVHFHGYPNASSMFDGVPDASIAINIAGSFTYYYTAPDAGTYFWHCHITPPEHLQMGMVGQLYVRPRQNRVPVDGDLKAALKTANQMAARPIVNGGPNTAATQAAWSGTTCSDILCTGQTPLPAGVSVPRAANVSYAYNDGDGSTAYDVEVPIQMMGFDPNFHYVGMTFNPEQFADMKDKYYLLSGRSYPDTVNPAAISTLSSDGVSRPAQPISTLITIKKSAGQTRALLRLSNLSVTEFSTLATVGVPMTVIADNARLLRDMAGNNMYYDTNSITMGGGESKDVILDVSGEQYSPGQTFFLYSTNLDKLSNDAENFGGMMTEIRIN